MTTKDTPTSMLPLRKRKIDEEGEYWIASVYRTLNQNIIEDDVNFNKKRVLSYDPEITVVSGSPSEGKIVLSNGDMFEGIFKDGIPYTGKGRKTLPGGTIYEGSTVEGYATGEGIVTLLNGTVYKGMFVKGKVMGKGEAKIVLSTGAIYEGPIIDRVADGEGIVTLTDRTIYKVIYEKGKIVEKCKIFDSSVLKMDMASLRRSLEINTLPPLESTNVIDDLLALKNKN